jgi:hypothetical protein
MVLPIALTPSSRERSQLSEECPTSSSTETLLVVRPPSPSRTPRTPRSCFEEEHHSDSDAVDTRDAALLSPQRPVPVRPWEVPPWEAPSWLAEALFAEPRLYTESEAAFASVLCQKVRLFSSSSSEEARV